MFMKLTPYLSVLIFALLGWTEAEAKTIECDNTMTAKCMCTASMVMKCGSKTGHIQDDAPLDYLKVVVTNSTGQQRTVTLNSPPGGIRDYYALRYNDWVKQNIKGLKSTDEIEVARNGYGLDENTPLYDDHKAESSIGTAGGGSSGQGMNCWYVSQPHILNYPTGCSKKACFAQVECDLPSGFHQGPVTCAANNSGGCPSADQCAVDEATAPEVPVNHRSIEVKPSRSSKGVR